MIMACSLPSSKLHARSRTGIRFVKSERNCKPAKICRHDKHEFIIDIQEIVFWIHHLQGTQMREGEFW